MADWNHSFDYFAFTPEEIELAMNHQVQPITLGKRILRTETAGMTVLSILMFLLEGKE